MGLANTDSSQLTSMRLGKVLYGWKKNNKAAVDTGASILSEQPSQQSGLVVLDRQSVGRTFTYDPTLPGSIVYPFTGISQATQVQ